MFFRQLLEFYKLRIHDLAPNSVLTLSNFVVLCEDYLQIKPDLDLWLELFYCNPQPETSGGPLLQCGAVALQRRLNSVFPKPVFPNRIKDWQKTFFYCKDTSPEGEPKLPLFSEDRLEATPVMKARCSEAARPKVESLILRIRALLSHNLENMDLVRCWTTWRIQPLSPRTRLICSYTRCITDDLRTTDKLSDGPELGRLIKKLTGKMVKDQAYFGLQPFCSTCPAPAVSDLLTFPFACFHCLNLLTLSVSFTA